MKIEAIVDKMMYGTIKVDIPDEQLRNISKREDCLGCGTGSH